MILLRLFQFIALVSIFGSLLKAVPISYSGKVSINGINFDGEANFIFEILNPNETVLWKNGNTSEDSIKVTVRNGRYLVLLGGQGMNQLPPQLFLDNDEVYLKVSVDLKNGQGFQVLGPNQRITSNGYAKVAELSKYALKAGTTDSVAPGSITKEMLSTEVLTDLNNSNKKITLDIQNGAIEPDHFNFTILDYLKPEIIVQPKSKTILQDQNVSFSINADGRFLKYQWKKNGLNLPGKTNFTLAFENANQIYDEGNYSVTVSNDFGFVDSTIFNLSIIGSSSFWDKTYGGPGGDSFPYIVSTNDGGYILAGDSDSGVGGNKSEPSKGGTDYWIVKIDSDGNKVWDKTYGGPGDDSCSFIVSTNDGGYILAGVSDSGVGGNKSEPSKGGLDYWIVKIDSDGNKVWDKTYGGLDQESFPFIVSTNDGGYILAGDSDSGVGGNKTENSKGGYDYWIVKIDSDGNKVWDKTYGGPGDDYYPYIVSTNDGGYILAGVSDSGVGGNKSEPSKGGTDYWIVKIDSDGNKVWDKTYGGPGDDEFPFIVSTNDGEYILAGSSDSGVGGNKSEPSKGGLDYWIVKIDSDGNKVWDKTYGGPGDDEFPFIVSTNDGEYILAGTSGSGVGGSKSEPSKGGTDYWIVKIDSDGNKVWDKTYGGPGDDVSLYIVSTNDGEYILAGDSDSGVGGNKSEPSKGGKDYWIVKIKDL